MFILLIITPQCREDDILRGIEHGGDHLIVRGSYDGTADYIGNGAGQEKVLADYRHRLESKINLLPVIVRRHFATDTDLRFEYKMALWDRDRHYLVLRYYAPLPADSLIAGYQIFFVGDGRRARLVKIFVSEVPLE